MNHKARTWLSPNGAPPETIRRLRAEVADFPAAYHELLSIGKGGEVGLKVSPFNLCLNPAESALSYWKSGKYTVKGVFVFGGNGGGGLLAFDMRKPGHTPVISFDPIDPDGSNENVARNFEKLIAQTEEHDALQRVQLRLVKAALRATFARGLTRTLGL